MSEVWDATLEAVKAATDTKETARNNEQVARAIAAASDSIENDQLFRRFYPEIDTRYFDWPCEVDQDGNRTLSLGRHELVSYTTLTVNGVAVDAEDVTLLPVNDGPPYTDVELSSAVSLTGDEQRAIAIGGTYGYWNREDSAGALAAALDDSATAVTVTDSAAVGVGHLLLVGSERMIVTGKSMADTAQNLGADLASSNATEVVSVTTGSAYAEGEVVMIDAEKMLIVEVAGNTLIVKRAWDGSTLAAHTAGADIYAPRLLTVQRGALGTAAAAHDSGTAVTRHRIPSLVNQLCIAEALVAISQENTGYGRKIGSGDSERPAAGAGIEDIRRRAWEAHGRKAF